MRVDVEWTGGQRFRGRAPDGREIEVDGEAAAGTSPMETLLAALGACMGIDIVDILVKGRQEVRSCRIALSGERRPDPPRAFTAIGLEIELEGRALSRTKAERAVQLSRDTYCSVLSSLRSDIELTTEIRLMEFDAPPEE